jgi:serine/threonine-protein kinase
MTSSARRVSRLSAETLEARDERPSKRPPVITEVNPYLAGEVIGDRYKLVRELGRGGMGVVWVAHSLVLGVDVALKLIRASAAGPAVSSRMAREAHAAARLGHPALVRVFDFGWTSRGDPFLVMELVQGETLSALLGRESRVPAIRAVQMLLPIADGLRMAHDKTIVHRDIKPDNIFLATDALGRVQPKLLDFGIAKVGPGPHDAKLTQIGVVLGSPEYMSPEQALGAEDVDQRTDVWSLSVVLYELVTGTIPFRRPNYNALMQAIIRETPRPIGEHAAGDESLWSILARGLAKEPAERWSSMTELGEALALWLYEHGIKEDLSGNSIRAVWLDNTVRVEHEITVPGGQTSRSLTVSAAASPPFTSSISLASLEALGRPRVLRPVFVALGLGVALGGVAVAALVVPESAEKPAVASPMLANLARASRTVGVVAPPAVTTSEPTPLPSAVTDAAARKPKSSDAQTSGRRTPSANPTAKKRRDFGF